MNDAKKYLLIDTNNASQISKIFESNLKNTSQRLLPPLKREINELDKMMAEVAQNQSLSVDERVDMYEKHLNNFLTHRALASRPLPQPQKDQPTRTTNSETKPVGDDHLLPIPKPLKNKAKSLYSYLDRLPITYSQSGEIIIKGKPIKNSNISDLLNAAVNSKAIGEYTTGWNEFQNFLRENNVPKSLLARNVALTINDVDDFSSPQSSFHTPKGAYNTPKTLKRNRRKRKPYTPETIAFSPKRWAQP